MPMTEAVNTNMKEVKMKKMTNKIPPIKTNQIAPEGIKIKVKP